MVFVLNLVVQQFFHVQIGDIEHLCIVSYTRTQGDILLFIVFGPVGCLVFP